MSFIPGYDNWKLDSGREHRPLGHYDCCGESYYVDDYYYDLCSMKFCKDCLNHYHRKEATYGE